MNSVSHFTFPQYLSTSSMFAGSCHKSLRTEGNLEDHSIQSQLFFPKKPIKSEAEEESKKQNSSILEELIDLKAILLSQTVITNNQGKPEVIAASLELKADEAIIFFPADKNSILTSNFIKIEEEVRIGKYTRNERQKKIKKYKEKLRKRRETHPVSRTFEGRRIIAFAKERHNGRFTKKI